MTKDCGKPSDDQFGVIDESESSETKELLVNVYATADESIPSKRYKTTFAYSRGKYACGTLLSVNLVD